MPQMKKAAKSGAVITRDSVMSDGRFTGSISGVKEKIAYASL
jgi:hypothetical protein